MKILRFCGDLSEKMRGRDSLPILTFIKGTLQDQSPDLIVPIPNLIFMFAGIYWSSALPQQPYPITISTLLACISTSGFYVLKRKPIIEIFSVHHFGGKRLILSRKYLTKYRLFSRRPGSPQPGCMYQTSPSSEGNIRMKRKSYLTQKKMVNHFSCMILYLNQQVLLESATNKLPPGL